MSTRTRNRLGIALGLAFGAFTGSGMVSPSEASSFQTLYKFCTGGGSCSDGSAPQSPVLKQGHFLYGTTTTGGAHGAGVVYRFNVNTSVETVLYSFCTTTGCPNTPRGNLIIDSSGNLYGTATAGGANSGGAVWELVKPATGSTWTFSDLYDFCATTSGATCTDGNNPRDGLTYAGAASGTDYDGTSLLFGTTATGGSSNDGTVFAMKLTSGTWAEKVIQSFAGSTADGNAPQSHPWMDGSNNLWGTTLLGGSKNKGIAYELTPGANLWTSPWTETIQFNFCWQGLTYCPEGSEPNGPLVLDASGDLFGTTQFGGNNSGTGWGMVFELTAGSSCTEGGVATFLCETDLYNFCNLTNCTDGARPEAGLVLDSSGNPWGTTSLGGTGAGGFPGGGTLFEYNGTVTVDHDFCSLTNCPDGTLPDTALIVDAGGNFYGTAPSGGDATAQAGTIFEYTP
jgi:uncharacterized repeat protein (TIGR03803 family)